MRPGLHLQPCASLLSRDHHTPTPLRHACDRWSSCSTAVSCTRLIPRPPSPSNSVPETGGRLPSEALLFGDAAAQKSPWCLPRTELNEDGWVGRERTARDNGGERGRSTPSSSAGGAHAARRCVQGRPHMRADRRPGGGATPAHHRARTVKNNRARPAATRAPPFRAVSASRPAVAADAAAIRAAAHMQRACGGGQSKVQTPQGPEGINPINRSRAGRRRSRRFPRQAPHRGIASLLHPPSA